MHVNFICINKFIDLPLYVYIYIFFKNIHDDNVMFQETERQNRFGER